MLEGRRRLYIGDFFDPSISRAQTCDLGLLGRAYQATSEASPDSSPRSFSYQRPFRCRQSIVHEDRSSSAASEVFSAAYPAVLPTKHVPKHRPRGGRAWQSHQPKADRPTGGASGGSPEDGGGGARSAPRGRQAPPCAGLLRGLSFARGAVFRYGPPGPVSGQNRCSCGFDRSNSGPGGNRSTAASARNFSYLRRATHHGCSGG
jgi:hypothetical protein